MMNFLAFIVIVLICFACVFLGYELEKGQSKVETIVVGAGVDKTILESQELPNLVIRDCYASDEIFKDIYAFICKYPKMKVEIQNCNFIGEAPNDK